jgi:hypothetical protein
MIIKPQSDLQSKSLADKIQEKVIKSAEEKEVRLLVHEIQRIQDGERSVRQQRP